jgi:hypothetical protein
MLRYGRKMQKYLLNRAMRRLRRMRETYKDEMLTTRQHKAVRQLYRKLLSKSEQEARIAATETVRKVAHNMLLSGKPTSAAATARLIEQETASLMEEILLSKREQL